MAPAGTDVNMKNRRSFRTRRCRELWCGSQMRLGSCVAVATAPIRPLAWEPPCVVGAALAGKKKKIHKKGTLEKENQRHFLEVTPSDSSGWEDLAKHPEPRAREPVNPSCVRAELKGSWTSGQEAGPGSRGPVMPSPRQQVVSDPWHLWTKGVEFLREFSYCFQFSDKTFKNHMCILVATCWQVSLLMFMLRC